jgi:hypothetical protein
MRCFEHNKEAKKIEKLTACFKRERAFYFWSQKMNNGCS